MNIHLKIKRFSLIWGYTSTVTNPPESVFTADDTWTNAANEKVSNGSDKTKAAAKTEDSSKTIAKIKRTAEERTQTFQWWVNKIFFLKPEPVEYQKPRKLRKSEARTFAYNSTENKTSVVFYAPVNATDEQNNPVNNPIVRFLKSRFFLISVFAVLMAVAVLSFSSNKKQLSATDYIQWVENQKNGLVTTKIINNYSFHLQYKPHEYMLLKQHNGVMYNMQPELQKLAGIQYYNFSISSRNGETIIGNTNAEGIDYDSQIEYFTSSIKDNIYLVENGDTLPCELSYFERNYGNTEGNILVLGFAENSPVSVPADRTLVYNDDVLNMGIIKLEIRGQAIASIPLTNLK